jgi:hypothetical protein
MTVNAPVYAGETAGAIVVAQPTTAGVVVRRVGIGLTDNELLFDPDAAYDGDIATLNIDGGTDIGAALVDADLIIVDDGAGGTNRKAAMSRVRTYIGPTVAVQVCDDVTVLTTGDGKANVWIPAVLNGLNLVDADAAVSTVSSSGDPTIQVRNVTDACDMLSTRITIDATEKTSWTAATAPVIDTSHDDVATGDQLAIDVDGAGTGTKGLQVILRFG